MLYSVDQIREIEQAALSVSPPGSLMRAAGKAAAQAALKLLNQQPHQRILVLAGPGNNGGDALEAAVHLAKAGHQVFVLHHRPQGAMSLDSQNAFNAAQACSQLTWLAHDAQLENSYALVIDGLFGIGLRQQKISDIVHTQIEQINVMACPILALDVPSGLDADTGNLVFTPAIHATHTITFIADKPGLHTNDGRDYAGIVDVADLDIALEFFPNSELTLNSPTLFSCIYQPRRHNSHKRSHGTVTIVGGALGMQGAVILAARAALYSGAGRVIAGFIESPPHFDAHLPELMCRDAQHMQFDPDTTVVIGPGLGTSDISVEAVKHALLSHRPLVIDADGLNLMAQQPALRQLCGNREQLNTLLTPHPLEAARLLECTVETIQADRINAAKKLAYDYSAIVILKGSGSIIAHPNGNVVLNTTGNPGLASAGTGDVLAGVCGSLLAQHKGLWEAALAATYIHGAAADNLVRQGIGPVGLCAHELSVEIRSQINCTVR